MCGFIAIFKSIKQNGINKPRNSSQNMQILYAKHCARNCAH